MSPSDRDRPNAPPDGRPPPTPPAGAEPADVAAALAWLGAALDEGLVAFDAAWRYTYVNPAAGALLGRDPASLVGRTPGEVFPGVAEPVDDPSWTELRRVMATRAPEVFESHLPAWGRWFENRAYPTADGGLLLFFRDVTARKRADAERERLLAAEGAARAEAEAARSQLQEQAAELEIAVASLQDQALELEATNEELQATAAQLEEQVQEREAALDAVRASETRYRAVVEASAGGIWHTDADGRATNVPPAWQAITGQPPEEVMGTGFLDALHPDDRDATTAVWFDAVRRAQEGDPTIVYDHEYRLRRFDGTYRRVHARGVPVRGAAGQVVEWVGTLADVEDVRAAEEALQRSEERLRQAHKMEALGQLAGGIAHDFNNLLTVIGGNLEFLRGDLRTALPPAHSAHRDVAEIAEAAERARTLVRQLLTFSRKQPVQTRRVDVGEMARGAERLLRRVIGEEITLVVDVAAGPAPLLVEADPGQLEQALLNLAVNARDAMLTALHGHDGRGGTLTLAVDAVTLGADEAADWGGASPGAWVRVRVRDTGHGMDPATQAHIFEPFFTTKEVGAGTGLGLATVFGTVQQSGGMMRVDSAPGRGSTFTLLLPPASPDDAPARHPTPAAAAPAVRATVLLVEDERAVRLTTRRLLERRGYTVREAADGAQALEVWDQYGPEIDVLVTDVRMPVLGGPELVARLRAERPALPVVFISGYVEGGLPRARAASDRDGAAPEAVVDKPFTADRLLAALAAVLTPGVTSGRLARP